MFTFIYDGVNRLKTATNVLENGSFKYSRTGDIDEKFVSDNFLKYFYQDNKLQYIQELGTGQTGTRDRVRFDYDNYGNVAARVSDPIVGGFPNNSTDFRLDDNDWEYSHNNASELKEIK